MDLTEDLDEIGAAFGLGWLAARFVSRPETWPEFIAWLNTLGEEDASGLLAASPDKLAELVTELRCMIALVECLHSADITIKTSHKEL